MTRSRSIFIPVALIVAGGLALSTVARSQQVADNPQGEMKRRFGAAIEKAGAPTEQHKVLEVFVGEFDQNSEIRIGPGEPVRAHAIAKGRRIMGGRFVQIDIVPAPDEELKGERTLIYGYDPAARVYTLYNLETGSLVATTATGTYDAASKKFTFDGEQSVGMGKAQVRWTLRLLGDEAIEQKITVKNARAADYDEVVTVRYTPKKK